MSEQELLNNILPGAMIISPLMGGMMNRSFIIEYQNKQYVLYLPTE